jgi:amidase
MSIDAFSSAGDMLAALARRELSAVELLELHLERIARHNPALNAIVIPAFDEARAAARAADDTRAADPTRATGALAGLPLTLKDSINVRGLRTTVGAPQFADFVSPVDAPIVARARAAGAVIVG